MGSTEPEGATPVVAASPPVEVSGPPRGALVEVSSRSYWRAVLVILLTLLGLWAIHQARNLVTMLVISLFFALALVPGVNHLHKKRGWKRGAAVGFIYLIGLLALILLTLVLIPAIAQLASEIGKSGSQWLTSLDHWTSDTFGFHIVSAQAASDAVVTTREFLDQWSDKLAGAASGAVSKGLGMVFQVATIATFTFYFAADYPRLARSFLSWFKPSTQQRLGWTLDKSVEEVGGYLYSKLLLTAINGLGFFTVMVVVGVPVSLAIPLAIFAGFVSEFIPNIGTYIGAAIPIALTLALQGVVPALVVLGYALVYQQIENYWLSPHISAKTMELNGGLAFGAALAGGALFGPLGAFMALPVAALIYAMVTNYRRTKHEVVYTSVYGDEEPAPSEGSSDSSPVEADPAPSEPMTS